MRGAGPLAVLAGIVAQSAAFVMWSRELLAGEGSQTSLADPLAA